MWKHVLLLLCLVVNLRGLKAQKAEDYKIVSLPGIDVSTLNFTQYAGHIEVAAATNSNLFFWMLEQVDKAQGEKLIIWLNGGPGCSSMDGLFLENGPYRVNRDLTLSINPGGWQDRATIVYLDQPVGTGFSFAETDSYMHNLTQIAEEFTAFLDKFLDIFPHLRTQDMYLSGESFAGTYIPFIASQLIKLNKENNTQYNLKGLAIGNGWISPRHQYNAYYEFAKKHNLLSEGYAKLALEHLAICRDALSTDEKINMKQCETMMQDIIDSSVHEENDRKMCINQYDIRLKNEDMPACGQSWPSELPEVMEYLRLPGLISAVHATKQSLGWRECSHNVAVQLVNDNSKPSYNLLPSLLEEVPILLYNGEYDLICNTLGTTYLIGNMTWNGEQGFSAAKTQQWTIDSKDAGYYTEARNLTFVVIKDGSHMVPYDRPIETLDMINRFMGVDNNNVNGLPSRVGLQQDTAAGKDDQPESENEGSWLKHYHWGTFVLSAILVSFIIYGCYWFFYKRTMQQHNNQSGSFGQKKNPIGWLRRIFGNGQPRSQKLRLDDQDEANELDELVVENSTLFAAEDLDEESGDVRPVRHKDSTENAFAIADEEDDEDFEDWDDNISVEDIRKKAKGDKDA